MTEFRFGDTGAIALRTDGADDEERFDVVNALTKISSMTIHARKIAEHVNDAQTVARCDLILRLLDATPEVRKDGASVASDVRSELEKDYGIPGTEEILASQHAATFIAAVRKRMDGKHSATQHRIDVDRGTALDRLLTEYDAPQADRILHLLTGGDPRKDSAPRFDRDKAIVEYAARYGNRSLADFDGRPDTYVRAAYEHMVTLRGDSQRTANTEQARADMINRADVGAKAEPEKPTGTAREDMIARADQAARSELEVPPGISARDAMLKYQNGRSK